jgi:hypothetical protein
MNHIEPAQTPLLDLLRRSDEPSEEDRARVRAAIAVALAPAATMTTAALAGHQAAAVGKLAGLSAFAKVITLVGVLGVSGAGLSWYLARSAPSASSAPSTVIQVAGRAQSEPVAGSSPGSSMSPPAGISVETLPRQADDDLGAEAAGRARAGAPLGGDLDAELRIIGAAQQSLKAGQAGQALAHLDEHQRLFPHGILALERSGIRTVALCQAGRLDEGRAAARSYLRAAPNSVLAKRIAVACQLTHE